jgi:hypothetical protein
MSASKRTDEEGRGQEVELTGMFQVTGMLYSATFEFRLGAASRKS